MKQNTTMIFEDSDLIHARLLYTVNKAFAEDGSYSLVTCTRCSACNHEFQAGLSLIHI